MTAHELDQLNWGSLRDWIQLVRLPAVFTLFSDCLVAAIVSGGGWLPATALIPIMAASLCAYWAGMILNDVVDLETDRETRPNRPLVSGRISPVIAGHVATGMLLTGPILILAVATFHSALPLWMGAAFLASVLLSLCVRFYDSALKSTPLGPILMGSCRALNILMVGSAMCAVHHIETLPRALWVLAGAMGIYILGVTVYARREDRDSSPIGLSLGLLLQITGLVFIACLPRWADEQVIRGALDPNRGYPLLISLIGVTVVHRASAGILHPVPRKVQLAVKHALLTIILLDAAIVVMWAGPWYGCAVVALLLPALASAMRYRAT